MSEIWKPAHFSDQYEVSNMGRIRYVKTGTIRATKVKHGKNYVNVVVNGEDIPCTMSKLVLSAFVRLPNLGEHSHHINGDRMDDRVANLQWTTGSSTRNFAKRTKSGSPIKVVYQDGKDPIEFISISSASDALKIKTDVISSRIGKGFIHGVSIEENPISPDPGAEIRTLRFGDKALHISSDGMIRTENGAWKCPETLDNGYIRTSFAFDQNGAHCPKSKKYYMHRLMAKAFHGDPPSPDLTDVHHIDEDKTNNHPSNLAWVTRKTNMLLTYGLNFNQAPNKKVVYKYNLSGEYTGEFFESASAAARTFGANQQAAAVSSCCSGKKMSWKGFEWSHLPPAEYADVRENLKEKARESNKGLVAKRRQKLGPPKSTGKTVYAYNKDTNEFVGEWPSGKEAAAATGANTANISSCIAGKIKHTKGLVFSRSCPDEFSGETSGESSAESLESPEKKPKLALEI